MDGVYSCCDRTDSEGIQDILLCEFRTFHRPTVDVILGPVFDNEKESWRILATKEMYAMFKNPTELEIISLIKLHLFWHVKGMEECRIIELPKEYYI